MRSRPKPSLANIQRTVRDGWRSFTDMPPHIVQCLGVAEAAEWLASQGEAIGWRREQALTRLRQWLDR